MSSYASTKGGCWSSKHLFFFESGKSKETAAGEITTDLKDVLHVTPSGFWFEHKRNILVLQWYLILPPNKPETSKSVL